MHPKPLRLSVAPCSKRNTGEGFYKGALPLLEVTEMSVKYIGGKPSRIGRNSTHKNTERWMQPSEQQTEKITVGDAALLTFVGVETVAVLVGFIIAYFQ